MNGNIKEYAEAFLVVQSILERRASDAQGDDEKDLAYAALTASGARPSPPRLRLLPRMAAS